MKDDQQVTTFLYVSKVRLLFDVLVVSLPGLVIHSVREGSLAISPKIQVSFSH